MLPWYGQVYLRDIEHLSIHILREKMEKDAHKSILWLGASSIRPVRCVGLCDFYKAVDVKQQGNSGPVSLCFVFERTVGVPLPS